MDAPNKEFALAGNLEELKAEDAAMRMFLPTSRRSKQFLEKPFRS